MAQCSAVVDVAARANDYVVEGHTRPDARAASDDHLAVVVDVITEGRVRVDVEAGAVDITTLTRQGEPHTIGQNIFMSAAVLIEVADVAPIAFRDMTVQAGGL